ncbi:MAG TPA: thioredoxin [Phycisphaerae bacterium]|jgi:thioredoxin 1
MASENVIQLTDSNFDTEVLQSQQPVLVDFWAEWCGPCRMIAPLVDALAEEYKGKVKIGKVDTDANRNTAMRFQIQSIPTIMIFKNGQLIQRYVGGRPKKELSTALDAALGTPTTV